METSPSFGPFKFKLPYGGSITLKLLFVGLLTLVLLIPAVWIMALIEERQERAEGVVDERAEKWSRRQTGGRRILVVPYTVAESVRSSAGDERTVQHTEYGYCLPQQLTITGKVEPEVLSRRIF